MGAKIEPEFSVRSLPMRTLLDRLADSTPRNCAVVYQDKAGAWHWDLCLDGRIRSAQALGMLEMLRHYILTESTPAPAVEETDDNETPS